MPEHIAGDCKCWGCVSKWEEGRRVRPLQLTVHPPVPEEPVGDDLEPWTWDHLQEWKDARWVEERLRRDKHLGDAELAAEYHAADAFYLQEVMNMDASGITFLELMRENRIARTLRRFAVTPHYWQAGDHGNEQA